MSVEQDTALPRRPSPGAAGAHLGELYAAHSRMVYGICRMLLRDPNEAEDATQQVFLAAYGNLLTGTEVRDPGAWLGTIARNACRRRAVARMREPLAVAGDEITLVTPAVDETAIGREEAAALYTELRGLPEKQREAIVLRDLYGLRYDEVAKALGTSRPAVEALLFRGRRRLQRRLRPGLVAGVIAVPLAVQESIAYAVPGFIGTAAAPAGAGAAVAGVPLLAKLAAGGAAVTIAGGGAAVVERGLHDPPQLPAERHELQQQAGTAPVTVPVEPAAVVPTIPARLLPAPVPVAATVDDEDEDDEHGGRAAGNARGEDEHDDNSGPGGAGHDGKAEAEHELEDDHGGSNSGPGSGSSGLGRTEDDKPTHEADRGGHSGPGSGGGDDSSSGSGSGGDD